MLLAPVLAAIAAFQRADAGPIVILIDGPSGAGKSTLADRILDAWPSTAGPTRVRPALIRLDDIYPGWNGLAAASAHLTEHVLRPFRAGLPGAWRRYDWGADAPAEWHPVDPALPLLVEGCGTLAAANAGLSDVRIWLTADDEERKQRALARDGEAFRSHWDQWQAEWQGFLVREEPGRWATIELDGTPGLRGDRGDRGNRTSVRS
ncbi:ATP-binding protein [Cryobacterium sp. 10C3]|uniref:ATP-binding protein n=1 Tax=Cryobacterium sp. 10C3 TaxID=3048577 RepID=UPI002AB5A4B1|nr:ATP-binding protein [Cryobacterium sp. 10C3]MDY7556177.1 ATP-binding protein [Cryobacterium sp. 10C3]